MYDNYKQALHVLHEGRTKLAQLKLELGLTDDSVFATWLREEKEYLQSRAKEPEEETLQMEYWKKLVDLSKSR